MAFMHTNACVYFAGLKPSDVSLMASMAELVPVIPLLAKVGCRRMSWRSCQEDSSL